MEIKQKLNKETKKKLNDLLVDYKESMNKLLSIWYDIKDFCVKDKRGFKIEIYADKTVGLGGNEVRVKMNYDRKTVLSPDDLYKLLFERVEFIYNALLDARAEIDDLRNKLNNFLADHENEFVEGDE
jgi:hypothetical protein